MIGLFLTFNNIRFILSHYTQQIYFKYNTKHKLMLKLFSYCFSFGYFSPFKTNSIMQAQKDIYSTSHNLCHSIVLFPENIHTTPLPQGNFLWFEPPPPPPTTQLSSILSSTHKAATREHHQCLPPVTPDHSSHPALSSPAPLLFFISPCVSPWIIF